MFKILRYSDVHKNRWNAFIKTAKNGLFFFERDYMEYHQDRFTDHSVIFLKGEEIISVFPATEKESIITSHGGLTFGSLLISRNIKAIEVLKMFEMLIEYYQSVGCREIIYKAIPYIFSTYPAEEDLYALYVNNAHLIRRDISCVVDMGSPIGFNTNKRRLVKKCKQNNVLVAENEDFSEYWNLLTGVLQKYETKPVHGLGEILHLKNKFPNNIRLFEARLENDLLAGTVVFDFGKVIHTQYLAISNLGKSYGALDFINFHLMENIFKDRPYYSFGISTENSGRYLNEGLIQQKENMGGRAVTLDFYRIDLNKTTND